MGFGKLWGMSHKETDATMTDEVKSAQNRLGIDASSLGKLKPKDLSNPNTASMVLSYLASVESENSQLKTQNETLSTYSTAYDLLKSSSKTAAVISLISVIVVGFGINYATGDKTQSAGIVFIIIGAILQLYSIWLSYKK